MSTLHDRLAELAEDAPPGGALPDLWQRGRRVARVRRLVTATVVLAACAALVVVGVLGWQPGRSVSVAPADGGHAPAMPDRLHEPSGWLGSFDRAPGVLAAVLPTRRQHLVGSEPGIVGVSATTGRYGFLDLPDLADGVESVALSPDGRRVAYWTAGETTGDPRTGDGDPVTGFAVYDGVTGRAQRVPVPTAHGLSVDQLAWVDDETLLVGYGQDQGGDGDDAMSQATSTSVPPLVWRVGGGTEEVGPSERGRASEVLVAGGHGWLVRMDDDAWSWSVESTRTGEVRRMRQPNLAFDPPGPAVSPDGALLAGVGTAEYGVLKVVDPAGDITAGSDARTFTALYWLDGGRLVGTRRVPADDAGRARLEVFDLRTRRWTALVTGVPVGDVDVQRYAFELLAHPTRPAGGPPHPWNLRVTLGLSAGIVVLAGFLLVAGRRRVRP